MSDAGAGSSFSGAVTGLLAGGWPLAWGLALLVLLELLYLFLAALGLVPGWWGRLRSARQGRDVVDGAVGLDLFVRTRSAARRGQGRPNGARRSVGASPLEGGALSPLPPLPLVSCIVTCYSEGVLVARTIRSLLDQSWRGPLEVLVVIDGAVQNAATLAAAGAVTAPVGGPSRSVRLAPKWIRGGRPSSLNAGLALSRGQLILALDGDTSFDRDMVAHVVERFRAPGVVAVAGTLRVRNADHSLLTRLQALDYAIFRQLVRAGLGRLGLVNNIPGAHGAFRREALLCAGGWDNGSAEDVDLSLRLRKCLGRYPGWRLTAAPDVIGHTDVPERWGEFLRQRLRWEGDPAFLFLRKHAQSLRPATMGWPNWIFAMWYGIGFQGVLPLAYLMVFPALLLLPWRVAVVSLGLAWVLHAVGCLGLMMAQVVLTSERAAEDARRLWLLPLYSGFVFLLRAWSGVSVLHSLLMRSERDSSMAPWWVLRKSRF